MVTFSSSYFENFTFKYKLYIIIHIKPYIKKKNIYYNINNNNNIITIIKLFTNI